MAEAEQSFESSRSFSSPTPVPASASVSSSGSASSGSSETSRKRFNLREAQSEVKALMDLAATMTWEERCQGLQRHYQVLCREYKKQEKKLVECQKKQLEVCQHRDVIQNEYARMNVAKGKLENLCRELQRHSKAVAEESKQRQRDDEERRREVSAKFQSTINDITHKMQEHHQRNQSLRQENLELMTKLKQISEQYEAREEHYEKMLKQKQLELQLQETKMAQQLAVVAEEKETSLAERQFLLAETIQQQKKCELLTQQEVELRGQLAMYSEKFEEFQQTLTKSNHVFSSFKKDTDKMAKTIGSLEKEVALWKVRYEKASKSLMETTEERGESERALKMLRTKTEKLERLCRALQTERSTLRAELKTMEENGRIFLPPAKQHESEPEVARVEEEVEETEDPEKGVSSTHALDAPQQSNDTPSSPSQTNGQDVDGEGTSKDATDAESSEDAISTNQ